MMRASGLDPESRKLIKELDAGSSPAWRCVVSGTAMSLAPLTRTNGGRGFGERVSEERKQKINMKIRLCDKLPIHEIGYREGKFL